MSIHGPSFDAAQRRHDNAEPPDYWEDESLIETMTDDLIAGGPDELGQITDWPDRFFDLGFEIAHMIASGDHVTYGPFLQQGYVSKEFAEKSNELHGVIRNHVRSIVAETINR